MIAMETSAKIGKSPKKPQVEVQIESDTDESEDSNVESIEENGRNDMESADEGDIRIESDSDVEMDSGAEGDQSDADEELSDSNNSQNEEDKLKANPSWADAMQKILKSKKPKRKKTIVLSKAKKLCDVVPKVKKQGVGFQIQGENGEIKEEELYPLAKVDFKNEKEAEHSTRKRREVDFGIRVKPSVLDREREKMLQKIATKGVVQLFNAVRQQQKEIGRQLEEAGPLERKREKVLKNIDKRAFLDVLMGKSKSISVDGPVKAEKQEKTDDTEKGEKTWDVLRDDFMMGAKLKDWDKKTQEDEDSSAPEDMDSDD